MKTIKVPDFKEFMTYEELNSELERRREHIKLKVIGRSNNGNMILCAKMGHGKKNALIFGFPHSDEPIGSLTCLALIDIIDSNRDLQDRYTWYIIPCADPDGAQLNEGWFKGGFSLKRYVYNHYRSRASLQTDWSFPVKYKGYSFNNPPKNVEALSSLIRRIKPSLVYPLHNAGLGGAYFFMTEKMPSGFYHELFGYCKHLGIPLDVGEPEEAFMRAIKKPVYYPISFADYYEQYRKGGLDPRKRLDSGTTSMDYTKGFGKGVLGLIGEIPYICDGGVSDRSLTRYTRADNMTESLKINRDVVKTIEGVLSCRGVNRRSAFYGQLKWLATFLSDSISVAEREKTVRANKRRSTVAERFSSTTALYFYRGRALGEARRLLLESKGTEAKRMVPHVEAAIKRYVNLLDRSSHYRVLQISKLVSLQLALLLLSIKYSR